MNLKMNYITKIICLIIVSVVYGIGATLTPLFLLHLCGVSLSVLSVKGALIIILMSIIISTGAIKNVLNN